MYAADEMNIHTPQSYEAEAELRFLSATELNIITPQEGKPIIVITQDALIAAYLMTCRKFKLKRSQFNDICLKGERADGTPLWQPKRIKAIEQVLRKNGKKAGIFNGRGLISLILPEDLYYEKKNGAHPDEPVVKIEQGVFLEGAFDKSTLGSAHNSLIQILAKEYGVKITANFIDNMQFIGNAWLLTHGFSVGLEDCMITSRESVTAIKDTLAQCYTKAEGIEETTQNLGIREVRVTAALSQAKDIGMRIAKDAMHKQNNFLVTVTSGAKGDFFNIAQLTGLLGQQNLEGKRVTPTLNHGKRTLPHYPYTGLDKEREYEARGFVRHSFIHGLTPEEFFFHSMSGREGVCDTAMGTAKSGYIQRRIIKVCEDIQIQYDSTVRDATGKIYQFSYGENGYDATRTVRVDGVPQVCDVSRLANRLNASYERGENKASERKIDFEPGVSFDVIPEISELKQCAPKVKKKVHRRSSTPQDIEENNSEYSDIEQADEKIAIKYSVEAENEEENEESDGDDDQSDFDVEDFFVEEDFLGDE